MNDNTVRASIPRPEYPRPDFQRENWLNLNGVWEFEFDDPEGEGALRDRIAGTAALSRKITVPFCYQSALSGIGVDETHEIVWYRRTFDVPAEFGKDRVFLNFGAVDYECEVWINGMRAGGHEGGHVPFRFDVTRILRSSGNVMAVRVRDIDDPAQPRGKQTWRGERFGCWYTPTTGIWQTVWLETSGAASLETARLTPDFDARSVHAEFCFDRVLSDMTVTAEASFLGKFVARQTVSVTECLTRMTIELPWRDELDDTFFWRPESPNLFDLSLTVSSGGAVVDSVKTYFGMRKIAVQNGLILLNNAPYAQKLILDQGYWPESLLTPPSDDAIRADIELAKSFGFNGARKHQKAEDPRFAYWADKLGFLVWTEMPSTYRFTERSMMSTIREWADIVRRDYNHPSIVTWVPINESWGVWNALSDARMQNFSSAMYRLTKALDPTRLVSSNDGWEQVESDICAIHDYEASGENFRKKIADLPRYLSGKSDWRMIYADGAKHDGEPLLLTEYGGISFAGSKPGEWGYRETVKTEEEFLDRFRSMTEAALDSGAFAGVCYTQLTDVMQEVNGLMTADRKPKVAPEKVRKILCK